MYGMRATVPAVILAIIALIGVTSVLAHAPYKGRYYGTHQNCGYSGYSNISHTMSSTTGYSDTETGSCAGYRELWVQFEDYGGSFTNYYTDWLVNYYPYRSYKVGPADATYATYEIYHRISISGPDVSSAIQTTPVYHN